MGLVQKIKQIFQEPIKKEARKIIEIRLPILDLNCLNNLISDFKNNLEITKDLIEALKNTADYTKDHNLFSKTLDLFNDFKETPEIAQKLSWEISGLTQISWWEWSKKRKQTQKSKTNALVNTYSSKKFKELIEYFKEDKEISKILIKNTKKVLEYFSNNIFDDNNELGQILTNFYLTDKFKSLMKHPELSLGVKNAIASQVVKKESYRYFKNPERFAEFIIEIDKVMDFYSDNRFIEIIKDYKSYSLTESIGELIFEDGKNDCLRLIKLLETEEYKKNRSFAEDIFRGLAVVHCWGPEKFDGFLNLLEKYKENIEISSILFNNLCGNKSEIFLNNKFDLLIKNLNKDTQKIKTIAEGIKTTFIDSSSFDARYFEGLIDCLLKYADNSSSEKISGFFRIVQNYQEYFTGNQTMRIGSEFFQKKEWTDYFKKFMEYIFKENSRDKLDSLIDNRNGAGEDLTRILLYKLKELDIHKPRKIVDLLVSLNHTSSFLREIDITESWKYETLMKSDLKTGESYRSLKKAIKNANKPGHSEVLGDREIPKNLENKIDNVLIAYLKNKANLKIQETLTKLLQNYVDFGFEKAFEFIRNFEGNIQLREKLVKKGVKIDVFEKGIEREYNIRTDKNYFENKKEKIKLEMDSVYNVLKHSKIEREDIKELKKINLEKQLRVIELKYLKSDKLSENQKMEIKGHIEKTRSISGEVAKKSKSEKVAFYVCQDPLESLHMGQYFGSCLSLRKHHGGCNSWGSIVQTIDINKNVIYAKTSGGQIIARNRTVLTDKGVLCTAFYQNESLYLHDAWIDYLLDFSNELEQDIMIPERFTNKRMKNKLKKTKGVYKKERTMYVEPAHFNCFYGDGLDIAESNNCIKINADVFVIKSKKQNKKTDINKFRKDSFKKLYQNSYSA